VIVPYDQSREDRPWVLLRPHWVPLGPNGRLDKPFSWTFAFGTFFGRPELALFPGDPEFLSLTHHDKPAMYFENAQDVQEMKEHIYGDEEAELPFTFRLVDRRALGLL
jgi:hypothetical protein